MTMKLILFPGLICLVLIANGSCGTTLYYAKASPPSRVVRLVAAVLQYPLDLKEVNLAAGEQNTPEYVALNPQHSVPFIVDEGTFKLGESRAIIAWLADKSGNGASLYPKDLNERALVNARLFFDGTSLYNDELMYFKPLLTGKKPDPKMKEPFLRSVDVLDKHLAATGYVATGNMTIADISCYVTMTNAQVVGIEIPAKEHVQTWMQKMETNLKPYNLDEINGVGLAIWKQIYDGAKE